VIAAATHSISRAQPDIRQFNDNYLELMDHFGMEPKTIQVKKANENGDIEAANGALKRRVKQQLLLRGSNDFESQENYHRFLKKIITKHRCVKGGVGGDEAVAERVAGGIHANHGA